MCREKCQSVLLPILLLTIEQVARSGNLIYHGGCVVQVSPDASPSSIEHLLRGVDCLVIVPNPGSSDMVHLCESYMQAAQHAGVKRALLCSILGSDDKDVHLSQKFRRIEDMFHNSGIENQAIVRRGVFQNWLYIWAPEMKYHQRFVLQCVLMNSIFFSFPIAIKEQAQYAPLNVCDLTMFCAHLIAEHGIRGRQNEFKLTGQDLMSGQQLVERLNRSTGSQIQYQQVEKEKCRDLLKLYLKNENLVQNVLDWCELINRGKLNVTSNDEKKNTGQEPIKLENFLKDNAVGSYMHVLNQIWFM